MESTDTFSMNYSLFSEEQIDEMYALKHMDAYEKLTKPEGWEKCMTCGVLPRQWRFDNGCWATCLCFRKYDHHPARTECVMSHNKRFNGNFTNYDHNGLMKAWNIFATTGVKQDKLGEDQW